MGSFYFYLYFNLIILFYSSSAFLGLLSLHSVNTSFYFYLLPLDPFFAEAFLYISADVLPPGPAFHEWRLS